MFNQMKETMDNFFKTGGETIQATFNTGVRMQEDFFKFFAMPFAGARSLDEMRKRGEQLSGDFFGLIQKNFAEQHKAFDATCKVGAEWTRRAIETTAASDNAELRDKTTGLWNTTFDALRTAAETNMNTGLQIFENFTSFVTRSMNVPEIRKTPVAK